MAMTLQANRKLRDDGRERCPACGGSRHPRNQKIAEDFRCHWTQFSHDVYGMNAGGQLPYMPKLLHKFADWLDGNARVRPTTQPDGTLGPYDADARVRFFT